ncbi:Lsr2 family protein (plasmid) [Rhodococcus koreensis]|nr:Lsr2 family protein [Rhodococcus koreensis]
MAAMAAVTARIEADGEVAGASDEAPQTTHESVEDTPDTTGEVAAADTTGPVVDGIETTATGDRVAAARMHESGEVMRRGRVRRPPDTSEHDAQPDTGADEDTDNGTTAALADDAPAADDGNAVASTPSTAEVRAWAHTHGFAVSDRGRLSAEIWKAHAASPTPPPTAEVRAWAHTHGFTVSDRGQLSAEVREAYAATHPAR